MLDTQIMLVLGTVRSNSSLLSNYKSVFFYVDEVYITGYRLSLYIQCKEVYSKLKLECAVVCG